MLNSAGVAERSTGRMVNPFYVALLLVSTVFVVTALVYLMGPFVVRKAEENPGQGSGAFAFAGWFDRHGPFVLGVEFVIMFICAVLAMVIDPWLRGGRGGASNARS